MVTTRSLVLIVALALPKGVALAQDSLAVRGATPLPNAVWL